jgi:hypothetical protein
MKGRRPGHEGAKQFDSYNSEGARRNLIVGEAYGKPVAAVLRQWPGVAVGAGVIVIVNGLATVTTSCQPLTALFGELDYLLCIERARVTRWDVSIFEGFCNTRISRVLSGPGLDAGCRRQ